MNLFLVPFRIRPPRIHPSAYLRRLAVDPRLLAVFLGLCATASLQQWVCGPGADYAAIFPPPWLGLLGVLLILAAALATRRSASVGSSTSGRRFRSTLEVTAAVLLIGASGGFVLDSFRIFFALTGIPAGDFATVDVPGAIFRGLSLLTALLILVRLWDRATGARVHARPVGAEERSGAENRIGAEGRTGAEGAPKAGDAPSRRDHLGGVLLWSGLLLTLPYPVLKLVWWAAGESSQFTVGFPAMELIAFGLAACLIIALTSPLGRHLPRALVAAGGWVASLVLLNMGFLMAFGLLAQALHLARGPVQSVGAQATLAVFGVYGSWLALGVVMLSATLRFISAPRGVPSPGSLRKPGLSS